MVTMRPVAASDDYSFAPGAGLTRRVPNHRLRSIFGMSTLRGQRSIQVLKFGGTSVGTVERIQRVVGLVRRVDGGVQRVVVVSALGGVTDELLRSIDEALERTGHHRQVLQGLRDRHREAAERLAIPNERPVLNGVLEACWEEVENLLEGIYLLGECTPRTRDAVLSIGERASAPLVAAAFNMAGEDAVALDARTLIRTDNTYGEASVEFTESGNLIAKTFEDFSPDQIAVVTGFIASTDNGETTTLGRSGSDYTATILGRALLAERVVIWTDVDGVLSADPKDVPEAFPLSRLSYSEAAEMAYFGARVLHPRTMRPVRDQGIPLLIKNSLNPEAAGTLISRESHAVDLRVKAISTIRGVAVVMLEGGGMLGVPGIAARVFGSLADKQINVLMIAQASSEHSICLVVREQDAAAAVDALKATFVTELSRGDVTRIYAVFACAVISAVGDQMRHSPGLAGRMFATLGRSRVNVLSIAQGAAETNISAVVRDDEVRLAVRALHEAFPLARLRAHVCLLGSGRVSRQLLGIIASQASDLLDRVSLNLRIIGLANSSKMCWDTDGIAPERVMEELEDGVSTNLDWLIEQLGASRLERVILVDATASERVAGLYPKFLELGIGVVTASKLANSADMGYYRRLQKAARRREVAYRYETTVGAGLPVLSTIRDLVRSGDRIRSVEGVLSGTLGYIFNEIETGRPFSEVIMEAHALGYTEPDPWIDLAGEDVARKLLILVREMGVEAEREDVDVESLIPANLPHGTMEEFRASLPSMDAYWSKRVEAAIREGKSLRYVATFDGERLSVKVRALNADSPFSRLHGTENAVIIRTDRYDSMPMVVRGPGAGPDVTAAGLLADIIKAAELMP